MKRIVAMLLGVTAAYFTGCDRTETAYYKIRSEPANCTPPTCTGYALAQVNQAQTRCPDGTLQAECLVPDIDLHGLNLAPSEETVARDGAGAGTLVLRGELTVKSGYPAFIAHEAWTERPHAPPFAYGNVRYYWIHQESIACDASVCPNVIGKELNTPDAPTGLEVILADKIIAEADASHFTNEGLLLSATPIGGGGDPFNGDPLGLLPAGYFVKLGASTP
jgi:hypothetical protein